VYSKIELDTHCSGTGTDTGTISGTISGDGVSSPQPPAYASRRAYRQSKPNQNHQQHLKHTVYVVDLEYLSTALLPGRALEAAAGATATGAALAGADREDHHSGKDWDSGGADGNPPAAAAAAVAVAVAAVAPWDPHQPIYLVVEIAHKASGLVISRGSASFRMAESGELEFPMNINDNNADTDADADEAGSAFTSHPSCTANSCYLIDIATDVQLDRQVATDTIIASQRDAKRAVKNAITR